MTITGTENLNPDELINFELAQKKKAPPVKTGQKQTSWQDANGSLKDLQPDSSLPKLPMHPAAEELSEWLPLLSGEETAELKESIQTNGIQVPILVTKGEDMIIDGRNRYLAAQELGLKVKDVPLEIYEGKDEDIPKVILSRNALRRHLTEDQRMAVIASVRAPQLEKEAKMRQQAAGGDKRSADYRKTTAAKTVHQNDDNRSEGSVAANLAQELGISQRKAEQLERARKAALLKDVMSGKISALEAAAKTPPESCGTRKTVEERTWTAWKQLLAKFDREEYREVKRHLRNFVAGNEPKEAK